MDATINDSAALLAQMPANFRARVVIDEDGCWNWIGCMDGNGEYPVFYPDGKNKVTARRFAWQAARGRRLPSSLFVAAKCGNKRCVNPHGKDHCVAGSRKLVASIHAEAYATRSNAVWKAHCTDGARKRSTAVKSMENADRIRARLDEGLTQLAVAREFGVSEATVRAVNVNKVWKPAPKTGLAMIAHQARML